MRPWPLLLLCAACGARFGEPPGGRPDGALPGGDARGDGSLPGADAGAPPDAALGPFGAPSPIAPAATRGQSEDDGTVSATGRELVYAVNPAGAAKDLYVLTRTSTSEAWSGAPVPLPFNTGDRDDTPRFSPDDKTLYFESNRPGGPGGGDIWKVTRTDVDSPWGTPMLVGGNVNSAANERWFAPCAGDRYMMLRDVNPGGPQNLELVEGVLGGPPPVVAAELASPASETGALLSDDCLTVHFASARDGKNDLFVSHRAAVGQPWSPPEKLAMFSTDAHDEQDPFLARDGRLFVFASDAAGDLDLYVSTR